MIKIIIFIYLSILIPLSGTVQSLFDEAVSEDDNKQSIESININGYIKSGITSPVTIDNIDTNYVETSLKISNSNNDTGKLYTDIRFRVENNDMLYDLREAWIELYLGPLDLNIGQQIIAWGRADGINPTDNLSVKGFSSFYVNEDDIRLSNFTTTAKLYLSPLIIETIVIPKYKYPDISVGSFTDEEINDVTYACKLTLESTFFEGSISWFDGRVPESGIKDFFTRTAAEQKVIGADFVFTFSNAAIRGESAYSITNGYNDEIYIPNPEVEYVIGIDSEINQSISLAIQYFGKWIQDWTELDTANTTVQISSLNRAIWGQTAESHNGISGRIGIDLFYETLTLDLFISFNLSTEELFSRFKSTWRIADAINIYAGINYIIGPEGTRADLAEEFLQVLFAEIKYSF